MAHRRLQALTASLAALLALVGCQRDDTPPTWHLTSPVGLVADSATAHVRIIGHAEDESGLASVEVSLLPETGSAFGFVSFDLEGGSADFDFPYMLGNLRTPTGNYVLKVTVSDTKGNFDSEFLDVQLTEIPLRLVRELYDVEQPGGMHQLYAVDANAPTVAATAARNLGTGITGFEQENVTYSLLTCTLDGAFRTFESFPSIGSNDFTPECEHNFVPEPFEQGYLGLHQHLPSTRTYLPTGSNPRCQVMGVGCFAQAPLPDVAMNLTCIGSVESSLYLGGTTIAAVHKLDRHELNEGGALKTAAVLDWAPLFCGPGAAGTVLVAGNSGGAGKVQVHDAISLSLVAAGDGPGPIRDMAFGDGKAWCITPLGLHAVNTTNGNLGPVLYSGPDFTCIEYDLATRTLYIGQPNGVEHLASDGSYLDSRTGISGTVRHITFVRNK